jgi:pimeloyl-ACP methyl ester carboxylesterase
MIRNLFLFGLALSMLFVPLGGACQAPPSPQLIAGPLQGGEGANLWPLYTGQSLVNESFFRGTPPTYNNSRDTWSIGAVPSVLAVPTVMLLPIVYGPRLLNASGAGIGNPVVSVTDNSGATWTQLAPVTQWLASSSSQPYSYPFYFTLYAASFPNGIPNGWSGQVIYSNVGAGDGWASSALIACVECSSIDQVAYSMVTSANPVGPSITTSRPEIVLSFATIPCVGTPPPDPGFPVFANFPSGWSGVESAWSRCATLLGSTPPYVWWIPGWSSAFYGTSSVVAPPGTYTPQWSWGNSPQPTNVSVAPPYGTGMITLSIIPATPVLVDPNTGNPATTLMSGPAVTTDKDTLASTNGRAVQGVAADGVTEVVVKVPASNEGDQVTMTLTDFVSSDDDGGLGPIGATSFTQSQVSVTAVNTSHGPYAFAIYRAPVDFARTNSNDAGSAQRQISIQVQDQTQGGPPTTLPIAILRPPVVMVHGLWDDWTTWNNFGPLITNNSVDSRFSIGRASYDQPVGQMVSATNPPYLYSVSGMRANSLGFAYNAPHVLTQIGQWIQAFRGGQNPLGAPVAASQADIVAHSMGGLITRSLVLQPNFLSDSTFGQGYIHKVITIDTPHLGSQVALQLMSPQENGGCLQNVLSVFGKFSLNTATVGGSVANGATADLQGDDTTGQLSPALSQLNQSSPMPIPVSLIAGVYTNFGALLTSPVSHMIAGWCGADSLAQQLTPNGWPLIFHGNPNDAIVSENSQLDGLTPAPGSQFFGYVHSPGTETLGFAGPSVLDAGSIPNQVISLLNTSWKNSVYYYQLNP